MKTLEPNIVRCIREFDKLEDDYDAHIKYIEGLNQDTYIKTTLLLRSANVLKMREKAINIIDQDFGYNPYICHEILMGMLIFDYPDKDIKNACRTAILNNQRVTLLFDNPERFSSPGMNIEMPLQHAMLYFDRYYDLIDVNKLNRIKAKVLRSNIMFDYKLRASDIAKIDKIPITTLLKNTGKDIFVRHDTEYLFKIFTEEQYKQLSFKKDGSPTVKSIKGLGIVTYKDREDIDQIFDEVMELGIIDKKFNLLRDINKQDIDAISLKREQFIFENYNYLPLKILYYMQATLAKLGFKTIETEQFMSLYIYFVYGGLECVEKEVISSFRGNEYISYYYLFGGSTENNYIMIDEKLKKMFSSSLFATAREERVYDLSSYPTAVDEVQREYYVEKSI